MIGERYGRLTVLKLLPGPGRSKAECKCDCGNLTTVLVKRIKSAHTKSCGCLVRTLSDVGKRERHGMCKTPEYTSWICMLSRCYNRNTHEYKNYGGRGVTVCNRWLISFVAFYKDMGPKPRKNPHLYSLDRIDNSKDYSPNNCRWATHKEQNRNKRNNRHIEFNGRTLMLTEWAKEIGISYQSLQKRLRKNQTMDWTLRPKS